MTDHETEHRKALVEAYRERVVAVAEALVESQDVDAIFADAAPCYPNGSDSGRDYCQIMLLHCYRRAGLTDETWTDGGGVWKRLGLPYTLTPQPADGVYLPKTKSGRWLHHMAVFVGGDAGEHDSIDGNTAKGIARKHRRGRDYNPRPFYIDAQPLVDAAIDRDLADTVPPPPGPDTSPAPPPFPAES